MTEIPRGYVFGEWDALVTDDDVAIPTPVGNICVWCQEAVQEGDNGRIAPTGFTEHRECSLRGVVGGIGHLVDHERYCHSEGPDAGLSYRTSAMMVWNLWQLTEGNPTPERCARYRRSTCSSTPRGSMATDDLSINDQYCLEIKRWGALGIEEEAGRLRLHVVDRNAIETWLRVTMETLGPGDRAELIITRGQQMPRQGRSLYEELAQTAPKRRSDLDPPLPGDDHPQF
jgi:hypothetical protein